MAYAPTIAYLITFEMRVTALLIPEIAKGIKGKS